MKKFDGRAIDWAGAGWYRLERKYATSRPSEKVWRKVETIDHSDAREMQFVERDDVEIEGTADRPE